MFVAPWMPWKLGATEGQFGCCTSDEFKVLPFKKSSSKVKKNGQGVTGHRIDLYWSPRRNIRGWKYCHVIGPIGISAVTKFFDLIQIGHRD